MKPLWKSKTFWFNALTIATEVANIAPLPPGASVVVGALVNIGLRMVTAEPVRRPGL
jgi:hypothetical protein